MTLESKLMESGIVHMERVRAKKIQLVTNHRLKQKRMNAVLNLHTRRCRKVMKYDRSIKAIQSILDEHSLGFISKGVTWRVVSGETTCSSYIHLTDTIDLHIDGVGWSWCVGKTTFASIAHELGHRFFEKILNKNILKNIT